MASEFQLEILSPVRKIFTGSVSEVVLPSYDGEVGILPGHEDFIGILGTGPLKIVRGGDDYWFMISSGIYQVKDGQVKILAELGEDAKNVNLESAQQRLKELDAQIASHATFQPDDYPKWKLEHDRAKARVDIYHRTEVVN